MFLNKFMLLPLRLKSNLQYIADKKRQDLRVTLIVMFGNFSSKSLAM